MVFELAVFVELSSCPLILLRGCKTTLLKVCNFTVKCIDTCVARESAINIREFD